MTAPSAELELVRSVSQLLGPWIEQERPRASPQQRRLHREHFGRFVDWVRFFGLRMPVSDYAVAGYLLEMISAGATVDEISQAAAAVCFYYQQQRAYLDPAPIKAALALAAAQLSPNRTLQ